MTRKHIFLHITNLIHLEIPAGASGRGVAALPSPP